MTKVQILSDVHLEFRKTFRFPQTAPYLALLGDVGQPGKPYFAAFINAQIDRYDKVFYVPGNHEFYGTSGPARPEGPYGGDLESTKRVLREVEAESEGRFVVLDCGAYDLDSDHVILGCTLWSNVVESQIDDVEEALADFQCIEGWSVQANNAQHRKELKWLRGALQDVERREKLAVVLTHHAPTHRGTSDPKYANSPYSSAFATDLDEMLRLPVVAWAFGHTHWHSDRVLNSCCHLVSNQVGNRDFEELLDTLCDYRSAIRDFANSHPDLDTSDEDAAAFRQMVYEWEARLTRYIPSYHVNVGTQTGE